MKFRIPALPDVLTDAAYITILAVAGIVAASILVDSAFYRNVLEGVPGLGRAARGVRRNVHKVANA